MEDEKKLEKSAKTLIIHPVFRDSTGDAQHKLEEAIGLAQAINLNCAQALIVNLKNPHPDKLLGSGKVEELGEYITNNDIQLAYVDSKLSPIQQRNLEEKWNTKVIDRSGLILEIFGARASTNEGKLQVELAALEYQKSRLVRSWTHLERQRGGFGFVGGPGEKQIELDKRMINTRIIKIKKDLEKVVKTRALHRRPRQAVPYPVVALVGYTNAGKSTLFNRLTGAKVLEQDQLFATLDPTMRTLKLPSGRKVILSDTVGFISDLPTELIAAFRATLEEVVEADILLHVRDISHPQTTQQKENVEEVLLGLGVEEKLHNRTYEVLNKIDLLEKKPKNGLNISALTGAGIADLLEMLDKKISEFNKTEKFELPITDSKGLAWLYSHGFVQKRKELKDKICLTVNISEKNAAIFRKEYL